MINKHTTVELPCAGDGPDEGCGAFELFFANEVCYLNAARELGDETDELHALLDQPAELREELHKVFVEQNFCVLALQRRKYPNEHVIPLYHDPAVTFSGCDPAQSFMNVRVHPRT